MDLSDLNPDPKWHTKEKIMEFNVSKKCSLRRARVFIRSLKILHGGQTKFKFLQIKIGSILVLNWKAKTRKLILRLTSLRSTIARWW
jgi:hypothetical protein